MRWSTQSRRQTILSGTIGNSPASPCLVCLEGFNVLSLLVKEYNIHQIVFHVLWQLILEHLDMDPCLYCSMFSYNLSCFISCLCTPDQNWLHFSLLSALTISIMQPPHLQLLARQTESKSKYWIFPLFQGHHVPRNAGDELCGVLEVTHLVILWFISIHLFKEPRGVIWKKVQVRQIL